MTPILQFSVLALVVVASVTDLRGQRVPNWLTGGGILVALSLQMMSYGAPGLLASLAGMGAGFGLLIFFYAVGGMGAGDVKLMASVGAFVGAESIVSVFVITGIAGGVYAIGLWAAPELARVGVRETFKNVAAGAKTVALTGQARGVLPSTESAPKLCYAVCIAVGVIAVLAYGDLPSVGLFNSAAV